MSNEQKPHAIPLVSEVVLEFGDGIYLFKLGLKWIDAIQKETGVGLGTIGRLTMGPDWNAIHVQKLIYYGLIGGGMPAVNARRLCETYIDGMPLARPDDPSAPLNVARAIIGAVYLGLPEDIEGKAQALATGANGSMSQGSTDRQSTSDRTFQEFLNSV